MNLAEIRMAGMAANEINCALNAKFCTMDIETVAATPSPSTNFGGVQFGGIDVFIYEGVGIRRGNRGVHHIREDRLDDFIALLPLNGYTDIAQSGKIARIEPGSFAFLSTAKPFSSCIGAHSQEMPFSSLEVRVSGSLLRQRIPCIDEYCDQLIKIRPGAGKIMHSMFDLALVDGGSLSNDSAHRFGTMLIDAVANAANSAPEMAALQLQTCKAPYSRIKELAQSVIDRNLHSPSLDADLIAAECRVSVRHLHTVFAASGVTIGTCIREARLQQCRKALQNPTLRHKSIIQIAMLWGFNDSAYFSRVYKARFGTMPKEDRGERIASLN